MLTRRKTPTQKCTVIVLFDARASWLCIVMRKSMHLVVYYLLSSLGVTILLGICGHRLSCHQICGHRNRFITIQNNCIRRHFIQAFWLDRTNSLIKMHKKRIKMYIRVVPASKHTTVYTGCQCRVVKGWSSKKCDDLSTSSHTQNKNGAFLKILHIYPFFNILFILFFNLPSTRMNYVSDGKFSQNDKVKHSDDILTCESNSQEGASVQSWSGA